jgi:hypothetical protein
MVDFNLPVTVGVFAAILLVGVGGLIAAPIPMAASTILMMVLPSMLVFGLVCLFVGMKFGEFRATSTR